MANTINTRIQLKYDSYANWKDKNPTLLAGEIAIAKLVNENVTLTADEKTGAPVLFKVGPGEFNALPWASALAADVYAWAKETNLTIHKDGTGNVVSGIEWDATLNGGKGGIKFTTAAVATAEGLEELQKEVYGENGSAENSRIDALEKTIANNTAAWTKDDDTTYTFEQTEDGKGLIITPKGDTAKEFTFAFLTDEELRALIPQLSVISVSGKDAIAVSAGNAPEVSLKIAETQGNVVLSQDANGLKANITLPTKADTEVAGNIVTAVSETDGEIAVTRKPIEVVHADGEIYLTINGTKIGTGFKDSDFIKDSFLEKVEKDTTTNEIVFTWNTESGKEETRIDIDELVEVYNGDNASIEINDYVVSIKDSGVTTAKIADGNVTKAKLDATVQASLDKADSALQEHQDISGKADKVTGATEGNFAALDANGNLTDSGKKAANFQPAGNYKTTQEAVAETGAANQTLKISQNANGEITATPVDIAITHEQVSGLHEIATTGSIYDIAEGANTTVTGNKEYLVFYCGTATDLID